MEHNENSSMKNMDNVQQCASTNNGSITVSHECRDTVTQPEIICRKSEGACPSTPTGNGSSGHKMGSRRIFTPQFKLQVLESYRNDNDCKGNQRATARKYNIHRRQIQKWLQCESSLRSSVANINQNTVKHQFHNISIHQHQQHGQKSGIPGASIPLMNQYGTNNNHQHSHLGLEATRTEAQHSTIIVPSLSSGVTTSTTQTQGVFSAANLAAVVAAAAGAAMTITSPPSSSANGSSVSSESVSSSPLRPPRVIGASGSAAATMSPLLHHHHHYGIPPYIHHTPATVQLPVPILAHHISHPPHIHQQAHQHRAYQYHNLAYTQSLTHQPSDKQQPQSSFLSSISQPDVNASAAPIVTGNGFSAALGEHEQKESRDTQHTSTKSNPENSEMGQNGAEQSSGTKISPYTGIEFGAINNLHHLYKFREGGYQMMYPLGPMDLSLRPRRDLKTDLPPISNVLENDANIVDLTHRKRKVSSTATNTVDDGPSGLSEEKHPKLKNSTEDENKTSSNSISDDEVDIEVGTEEKLPPSKPVKLFKPYLLDVDADSESSTTAPLTSGSDTTRYTESSDASPWIRYTSSISPPPHCYDTSMAHVHSATFQYSAVKENFTIISPSIENSNFPGELKCDEAKSAFTSIPTISPTSFRSPKGSPSSSGYESSSSTYSDSSFSSRAESYAYNRTYSLSLQMHPIHHDQLNLHRSKHVERWLEQESRNSSEPNSPIAILA